MVIVMLFDILVEETLSKIVSVKANSPHEAIKKVETMVFVGDISLDTEDWDGDTCVSEVEQ